jgi:hypothetical protein
VKDTPPLPYTQFHSVMPKQALHNVMFSTIFLIFEIPNALSTRIKIEVLDVMSHRQEPTSHKTLLPPTSGYLLPCRKSNILLRSILLRILLLNRLSYILFLYSRRLYLYNLVFFALNVLITFSEIITLNFTITSI